MIDSSPSSIASPSQRFHRLPGMLLGLLVLGLLLIGCPSGEPDATDGGEEAAAATRVENEELGVALATVPAFFRVSSSDGPTLVLEPADPEVEGVLTVEAGPQQMRGVNLVKAIEEHKEALEARQGGVFKGQRELGSHLGTAFYSRGNFVESGVAMEETAVFLIHPWGDRQLSLVYVYPAGEDSAARLQDQLFEVLGEVEGLEPQGEGAVEGEGEADPGDNSGDSAETTGGEAAADG